MKKFVNLLGLVSLSGVVAATGCVGPVRQPHLGMQMSGPDKRFLGRPVDYTLSISNLGDGAADELTVTDHIPAGMHYAGSTPPGVHDVESRTVSWNLGTLPPGAGQTLVLNLTADAKGQMCNVATAETEVGPKASAQSCTLITGLPELAIAVRDDPDPVEVGVRTVYTITVTNTGTEAASGVSVSAFLPPGVSYVSATGPTAVHPPVVSGVFPYPAPAPFGSTYLHPQFVNNVITFAPLPVLAPHQAAVYTVEVAGAMPQDSRFRVNLNAHDLTQPITVEESTRVY